MAGPTAQQADEAAAAVAPLLAVRPRVGLILGSGLGEIAERIAEPRVVSLASVLRVPAPTVPGHASTLVSGMLYGQAVVVMRGRLHPYEGHTAAVAAFSVRVLRRLGADVLIVTNAAGGIDVTLEAGTLLLIADHINLPSLGGDNPLVGWQGELPFVDMTNAYDAGLRERARAAARAAGVPLREGVYAMVGGPSYETPAEREMLRRLGADVVGMSTAHEVVVARHEGLRVLGLSVVTNSAAQAGGKVSHHDVLAAAARARADVDRLLAALLPRLA